MDKIYDIFRIGNHCMYHTGASLKFPFCLRQHSKWKQRSATAYCHQLHELSNPQGENSRFETEILGEDTAS